MFSWIKNTFLKKDFGFFLIIGVINTLNGIIFAFLYSLWMQANLAFVMGYLTALLIAYVLNSFFVFKSPLAIIKLVKFAFSYIPNFLIQNAVVFVVYNLLALPSLLAYAMAAALGVPVTFLLLKGFAFRSASNRP